MWPSYLKQHYETDHGYSSLTVVNAIHGATCIELKVVRQWHVDPGKYRVEEVETGSGEDTTVVDLPLRIKCPVLPYGRLKFKKDAYNGVRDFRMH